MIAVSGASAAGADRGIGSVQAVTSPNQPSGPASGELEPGVLDLLGVLCYGQLVAFERIAADAALAPTIPDREAIAAMAVTEFALHERLRAYLVERGLDPLELQAPFVAPLTAFHDSTRPADWLEGLVKVVVGDAITRDFYREVASTVGEESTRETLLSVLGESAATEWATERIRRAIAEEPVVGGRLALWARRLVGEALVQAQRVAVDRDALTALLVGGVGDIAAIGRLLVRLADAHTLRMEALGLDA